MPNKKFNADDRQLVHDDLINRILDMRANPFVVPDVAWDEQPVRYFKLNLQWCKILAGWLEWMEDVAGWQDAPDDLHAGIQGFLAFEVGINGGITMTPEEYEEASYSALYRAINDVAKQIVSGGIGGFSVDEDGNVVVGGDDGVDLPEDDPLTPEDEASESRTGSAIAYANGINGFFQKLYSLYGSDAVEDMLVGDAIEIMQNLYTHGEPNLLFTGAMNEYWTRRAASDPVVQNVPGLAEALFCDGFSLQTVVNQIYETESDVDAADNAADLINSAIDSDLTNLWLADGSLVGSTDYRAYHCTPIATEEFTLDMASSENPQYVTNGIHKAGHRILFEVSGSFTDPDFPDVVQDFFYSHTLSTGDKFYAPSMFQIQGAVGSFNEPSQAQVPFQPSHSYRVTIDFDETIAPGQITVGRNNDFFTLPNVVGTLTFKITDLGEY